MFGTNIIPKILHSRPPKHIPELIASPYYELFSDGTFSLINIPRRVFKTPQTAPLKTLPKAICQKFNLIFIKQNIP